MKNAIKREPCKLVCRWPNVSILFNKQTIVTILLALVVMAVQAKTYKTIKAPEAMACVNVHLGELKAREVVMTDTATTVHFTMEYQPGQSFRFVSSSYLQDEDGNRYPLRSAEGLKLDSWVTSPASGTTNFTMHFEPLPKRTQIFDFIEGDVSMAFMLLGIHDKKTKLKIPTLQELLKANPYTVPADWFKTDTITIRGRFEGYNAESFGFTSMECYYEDIFEKDGGALVLDIAPDGTFEKKFLASYPIHDSFSTSGSKVDFQSIPFFARPGESIDITIRKNEHGRYQCLYNNGSSKDVERWLNSNLQSMNIMNALGRFRGKFEEANLKADEVWQNMLYRIHAMGNRDHFTPMEMQLALAEAQASFACAYMDYAMYHEDEARKYVQVADGYEQQITDSAEWEALCDAKNYRQLQRIDFDNPLMMVCDMYRFTLNRIQFAQPVRQKQFRALINEEGEYEDNAESKGKELAIGYAVRRELLGCEHDNLLSQLSAYKDMLSGFNFLRMNEDAIPNILADTTMTVEEREKGVAGLQTISNVIPLYLATFTNPYIRQKAEQYIAAKMAQKELSSPLPSDNPSADLIRSLSAKYPGRFLIIDFWGMGCGPCRGAIQQSKNLRAEIAKRNDVKLIFIAGESTAEGSEAYHKYVNEWLADEETVCITNSDFRRLQEMFQFNGIPHYETITPDCRRVRDDLRIDGFHNFDFELKRLLEKLK